MTQKVGSDFNLSGVSVIESSKEEYSHLVQSTGLQALDKDEEFTKSAIFSAMRKIIGLVQGQLLCTGFFVKIGEQNKFVSTFHSQKVGEGVFVNDYKGVPTQLDKDRLDLCERHDICLLDCWANSPTAVDYLPLAPPDYEVNEGDTVYFAGFPLEGTSKLIFHKGYVSSVDEVFVRGKKIRNFTIDGTIVAGHSGSPVVVKDKKQQQLHLIGMIVSEVINSQEQLNSICEHEDSKVREIARVIRNNLSTGMGRAVDIRICELLLSKGSLPLSDGAYKAVQDCDLEVGKPVISGSLPIGDNGKLRYWEWMPTNAKGKGPRGLTFIAPGMQDKMTYKFEEQPHDNTSYNKNQGELYSAAATKLKSIIGSAEIPQSFEFECYRTSFKANLQ